MPPPPTRSARRSQRLLLPLFLYALTLGVLSNLTGSSSLDFPTQPLSPLQAESVPPLHWAVRFGTAPLGRGGVDA